MKGRLMTFRGRPEEALTCLEAADRLNPLRSRWYDVHSRHRPLFASALCRGRPRVQTDAPANLVVDSRGSRRATPSLNGPQRHRQRWRRSCGCSPTSRRRNTCARASSLNTPKTGSFSAKGSSRPDCRRELVRAPQQVLASSLAAYLPTGLKCSRERRFVVGSQPLPNARFKGSRHFRVSAVMTGSGMTRPSPMTCLRQCVDVGSKPAVATNVIAEERDHGRGILFASKRQLMSEKRPITDRQYLVDCPCRCSSRRRRERW